MAPVVSFLAFQQVFFSGLSEERGVEEDDSGLGPWLEIVWDHTSNYEHETKNNSESQVSWFYRGEKLQWALGVALLEGRFNISFYGSQFFQQ